MKEPQRRPVAAEPRKLAWYGKDLKWLVIYFDAQGRIGGLDIKAKDRNKFKYIYNSIRNGSVFQLHAYQGQCGGGKNVPPSLLPESDLKG